MHASRRRAPRPARAPATGGVDREPVGDRMLGGLRAFRYEIRRWPGGRIPDVADAVDSPQRLTDDPAVARRLLQLAPKIPRLVWGRDEARTGDMWTSNSITAWLLVRSAIDPELAHIRRGVARPDGTREWRSPIAPPTSARTPDGPSGR